MRRHSRNALAVLAVAALAACAGGGPRSFRGSFPTGAQMVVAALPLANLTTSPEAARVVLDQLVVELLKQPGITLVPPAAVEQALNELRVRDTGALTLDQTRALGEKLQASILIFGTVSDFREAADGDRPLPVVALNLRAVETQEGRVVWACAHSRTGSDTESVFGIGRVTSLSDLSSTVVRDMVATLPSGGSR